MLSIIKTSYCFFVLFFSFCFGCLAQNQKKYLVKSQKEIVLEKSRNSIITSSDAPSMIHHVKYQKHESNSLYLIDETKLLITANTTKNIVLDMRNSIRLHWICIHLRQVGNLTIIGNGNTHISIISYLSTNNIKGPIAGNIEIKNCNLDRIILPKINMRSLIVDSTSIGYMKFNDGIINKYFMIKQCSLDSSDFTHTYLPTMLYLDRLSLEKKGSLDFSNLKYLKNTKKEPALELERTITLRETDLDRIYLQYDRFSFHIDSIQCPQHRIWIYEKVLKHMNDDGLNSRYIIYNMRYNELTDSLNHKPITNFVAKVFWNKGKNRSKVIIFGGSAFFVFFIANFLLFKSLPHVYLPLNFRVYFRFLARKYRDGCRGRIGNWKVRSSFLLLWYYMCGITLYTLFIFFGLKLNMDDFKLGRWWLVVYILAQYTLGLFFVAYIISFIIIRP